MIYDYLFYKSYQLGKLSRSFEDMPILAGIIWVGGCFMFNIFTIAILLEASGYSEAFIFEKKYKFLFSISLVLLLLFYYSFGGRYKKIINKFEEKERRTRKGIHPIVVILIYYVTSFVLLLVSGMYKNGDGIFK